jgi:hypothetical protein
MTNKYVYTNLISIPFTNYPSLKLQNILKELLQLYLEKWMANVDTNTLFYDITDLISQKKPTPLWF